MSDVYCAAKCASNKTIKWDSIAVIEELANFDKRLEMNVDPDSIDSQKQWGDNYFIDKDKDSVHLNYFVLETAKVARYALPFVKNIQLWL